jgi:osmotically inducible protein OsmC
MKILYSTQATSTGGREGKSSTADGVLAVTLSTPKELGGGGGPGTNPEQLFAAGYSACFLGALKSVAGKARGGVSATKLEVGCWRLLVGQRQAAGAA